MTKMENHLNGIDIRNVPIGTIESLVEKNIYELTFSYDKQDVQFHPVDVDRLKCICRMLENPNCPIKSLTLNRLHLRSNEWVDIADSIGKNRSLTSLSLVNNLCMDAFNPMEKIVGTLQHHSSIKTLHLEFNVDNIGYFGVHKLNITMLKSLKHLKIIGLKVIPFIESILGKNQLETLYVPDWIPNDRNSLCDAILANRSITEFTTNCMLSLFHQNVYTIIDLSTKRNAHARCASQRAALVLIACRTKRKHESGPLGLIPIELVIQMAKIINSSYLESVWDTPKPPTN